MRVVVIGAGNMGKAMISGLGTYDVTAVERSPQAAQRLKSEFPSVDCVTDETVEIGEAVVILAVKPGSFASVATRGTARAVISVMAGVPLERLREGIAARAYIRAMPNVAAMNGRSMTTVTGDGDFREEALALLGAIGRTLWVESEKELDIATAVAGSGPAYMMLVAEALADGAVRMGMKRADASALVQGLFEGSAALLEGAHPAVVKDSVMSPGGTTAAGYAALEAGGVRSAMIEAVRAAYERACEFA